MSEKSVVFSAEKKFLVKGNLENPKALIFVFHGYGQLVEYFSRKFECLEAEYKLVFPQATSKFYINPFDKVGASWLTKVDKDTEMANNYRYLDKVWEAEYDGKLPTIVVGFSQGVSILARWLAKNKINFRHLILWAGSFPMDVVANAFDYLQKYKVDFVVGDKDIFYSKEKVELELKKLETYFSLDSIHFHSFDGGHDIDKVLLKNLLE